MRAKLIQILRVSFAVLSFTAIITQFARHNEHGFNTLNFFSYFTNLSNTLFALLLLTSGIVLLAGRKHSQLFDFVRGASVLCMAIVGIVFSLLLRNEDLGTLLPWVNFVVHYLMPVVAVVDWLVVPPELKFQKRHLLAWLIFPLIYLSYSLIRGASVHWYPYPFLNPTKAGGYAGVTLYCVGIFVIFLAVGWGVIALANWQQRVTKTKP